MALACPPGETLILQSLTGPGKRHSALTPAEAPRILGPMQRQEDNELLLPPFPWMFDVATEAGNLGVLAAVLEDLARRWEAFGCILWQLADSHDRPVERIQGLRRKSARVCAVADWFEGGQRCYVRHIPLLGSLTGNAILEQRPQSTPDIATDPRMFHGDPFLFDAGVVAMCAVPLQFKGPLPALGALSVYWRSALPFDEVAVGKIARFAAATLPAVRAAIEDRIAAQLLRVVESVLRKSDEGLASESAATSHPARTEIRACLNKVCETVAQSLQAYEVSVFLSAVPRDSPVFRLRASTWPADLPFRRKAYRPEDSSLTGWVLRNRAPVVIPDLYGFHSDRSRYRRIYPGIDWSDSLDIRNAALRSFGPPPARGSYPTSYVAAPIMVAGKMLGVIRCCSIAAGNRVRAYYGDEERRLLGLVAAPIAHYWDAFLRRRDAGKSTARWTRLHGSVRQMRQLSESDASGSAPVGVGLDAAILRSILVAMPSTHAVAIREPLGLEVPDEICAVSRGRHGESIRRGLEQLRFCTEDLRKAAHSAMTSGRPVDLPHDGPSTLTRRTSRILLVPFQVDLATGSRKGTVEFYRVASRSYSDQAKLMAEMLVYELKLLWHVACETSQLRREQTLQEQVRQDLAHQVRSPLQQIRRRAERLLRGPDSDPLRAELQALRGISGKALQVVEAEALFVALARGDKPKLDLNVLTTDALIPKLIQAAGDNEIAQDFSEAGFERVRFHVDRKSFSVLNRWEVLADPSLLLQSVDALLDNAGKYSFAGTTVTITGSVVGQQTARPRFAITVTNRGIRLYPYQVEHVTRRAWRSDSAKALSGEGSGIGLWFTAQVMVLQGGRLVVEATDSSGYTRMRLELPARHRRNGR